MDADQAREFIGGNSRRETAIKVKNLRRNNRATYLALTDRFYGDWVGVEGPAAFVTLPEAMHGLVDYYRRAGGEHPDWENDREAMVRDRRLLIRVAIEGAGPNVAG